MAGAESSVHLVEHGVDEVPSRRLVESLTQLLRFVLPAKGVALRGGGPPAFEVCSEGGVKALGRLLTGLVQALGGRRGRLRQHLAGALPDGGEEVHQAPVKGRARALAGEASERPNGQTTRLRRGGVVGGQFSKGLRCLGQTELPQGGNGGAA